MRKVIRSIILFLIVVLAIGGIFSTYNLNSEKPEEIGVGEMVSLINNGEISEIKISGDKITFKDVNGNEKISFKEPNEPLGEVLQNYGADPEKIKNIEISVKKEGGLTTFLVNVLPFLLPFLFIGVFIYFMLRQVQGANSKAMSFGKTNAKEVGREAKDKITFNDVAGVKTAKEELEEVVDFLRHPKKFSALGAKIPKGVLLMGSPGTGKTLLAKAVSGEASVPFFHISGSEFVEMFVGVGASRVRDLFEKAKKNAPCIIFIDEIDAVGRQRGSGLGGSHDEREQTLNQILVEMDGFDPNIGIIVIAATNRPDVLDPALLRPGRFDRRVVLDEPDIKDREEILKIHAKNKPLAEGISLKKIAERTPGFSGADLANLLNEAAIAAARKNKKKIDMEELFSSVEKVLLGPERKSRIFTEEERKKIAYHEAGHALVAHELPNADPVHKISIISRGQAAGYTLKLPVEDRHLRSKSEFLDDIAVTLGGFVVEDEIYGETTTGPSNDLQVATKMARSLVTRYGMSETLGPRTYGETQEMIFLGREISEKRDYSDKVAEKIDDEVSKIINNGLKKAEGIIRKEKDKLEKIVEALLKKETLEREEFEKIVGKKVIKKG